VSAYFLFLPFFFLEKKETKIQGETPNPFFLHTGLRSAARKNVFRTVSPKSAAPLPTCALLVKLSLMPAHRSIRFVSSVFRSTELLFTNEVCCLRLGQPSLVRSTRLVDNFHF